MPRLTFITYDGATHVVDAAAGQSLMQAALGAGIAGIDADCGGQCSCATCHVIVDDAWAARVGAGGDLEAAMLGLRPERSAHSRLSCQIELTEALDGIVVRIPQFQM